MRWLENSRVSSNGRTAVFEAVNGGSTPSARAVEKLNDFVAAVDIIIDYQ